MHTHSFLFLADGFEEIEALATVDIMRRAGMDVKTVSITTSHHVTGAHGIPVTADITFKEADFSDTEWLILPGGMPGASNLAAFAPLNDLVHIHASKGKVAAICAAPAVVLAPLGILDNRRATCYPGFEQQMAGVNLTGAMVEKDGDIITGKGPAAAISFALAIVEASVGSETAHEVAEGMLLKS